MKQLILALLTLSLGVLLYGQDFRKVENFAFQSGEQFEFRVYYNSWITGNVTAGYASMQVNDSGRTFQGRPVYHVVGTGKSKGFFDLFFKVRDRFESYIDKEGLFPWHFVRRTREGGYVKDDDVAFDHLRGMAVSSKKTNQVVPYVQDIMSAFYYARNLDFNGIREGDTFPVNFFLDDSVYISVIQFEGREEIKTRLGTFKTLKFRPKMVVGEVFDNPYPMALWVSDDQNRIPLLAESEVIVGSVKMEMTDCQGLANPLEAQIKKRKRKKR